jgi:AAA ATPase-like protein
MSIEMLPNLWHTYNLRESPYFQDTLGGDDQRHPLSLFVGRGLEQQQLLATIGGSHSSRQAVGGAPGVGKTTLIQQVKGAALAAGYLTTDRVVPLQAGDTADTVLGRLLGGIYETLLATRPAAATNQAMLEAQQVVRAMRLGGGGATLSVLGFGGGVTTSSSAATPPLALQIDGPRLIRNLLVLVDGSDARGLLLHVNNLENLTEADAERAADILRSLRDPVLMQPGLHVLLVGTIDAIVRVTQTHAQVRSVFTAPMLLEPLPLQDVGALLTARYDHLRLDDQRPVISPVAPAAVDAVYPLFRGDLRGLLKALEEAATTLHGVAAAPIPEAELRSALRTRYAAQMQAALDPTRREQVEAWGRTPDAVQTQGDLTTLWTVTQPTVSRALTELIDAGYVTLLPRRGRALEYVLTGQSRLIFG